jgi:peptide/nickel transport system substrate-binding protein
LIGKGYEFHFQEIEEELQMNKKLLNALLVIMMLAVLVPTALAAPPAQEGGQDYVVVADDWLSKLADKYLGNALAYPAIVHYTNLKNKEDSSYARIMDPDLIEVGWKIYIPSAEEAATQALAGVAKSGGTVVWANWPDPDTLDPHGSVSSWAANQYYGLYDLLVWRGPNQDLYPGLAKDWEVSDDGTTYTFYLRDDVTFQDGTPFNAEAVKFNLDRIQAETAVRASGRSAAHDLIGSTYESTEVVDEFTVTVRFSEPYPGFLNAVSSHFFSIVSPAAVEKWGDDFMNHPVGTGPFMFEEYVLGERVTLVRNPDYNWASPFMDHQGPAYLDKITHVFVEEDATRAAVLEAGEVQLTSKLVTEDALRFAADPNYKLITGPPPGLAHVLLPNADKYPTNDIRVRQALIYATDQELLVETLWPGFHSPAYGPLTSATTGYNPAVEDMYGYDPEKAKALLEEAGWTVGPDGIRVDKDGNRLHLVVQSLARAEMIESYEFLQAFYKDVGIEIEIIAMETAATNDLCTAGEPEICPLYFSFTDPGGLSIIFDSKNAGTGFNWGQVKDPKVDQLLADGAKEVDERKRNEIYGELQVYLMEQAYTVPLNAFRSGHAYSPSIGGVTVSYTDAKYLYSYDLHFVE